MVSVALCRLLSRGNLHGAHEGGHKGRSAHKKQCQNLVPPHSFNMREMGRRRPRTWKLYTNELVSLPIRGLATDKETPRRALAQGLPTAHEGRTNLLTLLPSEDNGCFSSEPDSSTTEVANIQISKYGATNQKPGCHQPGSSKKDTALTARHNPCNILGRAQVPLRFLADCQTKESRSL